MAEFMTTQDVLKELQIDEDELHKLVSKGELRAFKDASSKSSMKFKKDDVQNLKKGRETEPTIILTDSDQEMGIAESSDELILDESTSDTVLNIGDIMSPEKQEEEIVFSDSTEEFSISPHDSDPEAAIPTVEVPSVGEDLGISGETDSDAALVASKSAPELKATTEAPSIRDSTEDLMAAEPAKKAPSARTPAAASGKREVVPPAAKSTGKAKAVTGKRPVVVPEEVAEEGPLEIAGEEDLEVAPRKTQSGRISRSARLRAIQMKQRPSDMAWSAIALIAAVILLLPGAILFNRMMGVSPAWVTNWADKFRGIGELFAG